jgi:hypothetical protein
MSKQISLTIPETMFRSAQKMAKKEGYRSVQEFVLQLMRDRFFLQNLPRYQRIASELDEGKGTRMTVEEFLEEGRRMRRNSGSGRKTSAKGV